MGFDVRFVERPSRSGYAYAKVSIGDFEEAFEVDLSFWTRREYEWQWRDGLKRLVSGEPRSCLIASLSDPRSANFVFLWSMYAMGGNVVFQNRVLFLDEVDERFDPSDPYRHVGPREAVSTGGEPVSEWDVPVESIAEFLRGSNQAE